MTTAEHFADAMNARRVIHDRAFDTEHAESLERLLSLTPADISNRYGVGAHATHVEFIDGSTAVYQQGRWHA